MRTPNCSLAKMLQSPEREGNTTWNNNIMSSRIGSIGTYQIHPNLLIWVQQKVCTKDKQLRLKRTSGLSRLQGVKRLAYRCLDSAEIPFHQQESMRIPMVCSTLPPASSHVAFHLPSASVTVLNQ